MMDENNECIETPVFDFCIKAGVGKKLEIELQGSNKEGEIVPINLRGFTVAMQVKQSYESFYPVDELTTENGRIEVPHDDNYKWIIVYFPSSITKDYPSSAVYDIKIKGTDDDWERILKGSISTEFEVTKID